jgi:hypothetical protein
MASHPTPGTSFRVADAEPQARLVWAKPDSTWAWTLAPLAPGRTRLVTRLGQRYHPTPAGLLTIILPWRVTNVPAGAGFQPCPV